MPSQVFPGFAAVPAGARFHRVDLHIHSFGASTDVADAAMTPKAIVAKAIDRGIGLIALADHNSIASVAELLREAKATAGATHAIPGVEITTSLGHVLVYCGEDKLEELEQFLTKLDFRSDEQGELYTRVSIDDIASRVAIFGGVAIPAHCGRRHTGFLTKAPHRDAQAVFESEQVLGVELDGNQHVMWFTSLDRSADYQRRQQYLEMRAGALQGRPAAKRLARLLFSDAHTLEGVGRTPDGSEKLTRIKMERPCFEAFRSALLDPDARIVLEQPLPEIYPRIVGIRYVGGFLDEEEIAFAPNLTALIGGRGAGKSTAIEALRCACLGTKSDIEGSDAWPQAVQIEFIDSFGAKHLVQRDSGTGVTNEVLADGSAVPIEIPLEGYEQDHIAETIRSSDKDPRLLLEFLDRFVGSDALDEIDDLRVKLVANAEELLPVFGAPRLLRQAQADLAAAKGRIQIAEQSKAKDALTYRRLLNSERRLREAVKDAIDSLDVAAGEVPQVPNLETLASEVGIADLAAMPAKRILQRKSPSEPTLDVALEDLAQAVEVWKSAGATDRKRHHDRIEELLKKWEELDRRIEARIQRIVEKLRLEGITPDLSALNKLAAAETTAQENVTRHQGEALRRKRLLSARAGLLTKYRQAQARRTIERNSFGKRVAQQFKDAGVEFSIGMKFREGRLVHEYEAWLRDALAGRFLRGERVTQFCEAIHPIDLADQVRTGRTAALAALKDAKGNLFFANVPETRAFVAHVAADTARLFRLETILREDRPEITLTQTQDGKTNTYPFRHLSFGQRASILLGVVLFSDQMHPLVIDQPEDHLDSAFIYEAVVQTLRRVKERRQVIVATHNANIAILGDAELIVPLRSWAGRGRIRERGSVDTVATRGRACKILEGGEDAYRRRGEMYGLA